jgi:hypothetical protein
VIKLYVEQEEARLHPALTSRISTVERMLKDLEHELHTYNSDLSARLNDPMVRLESLIAHFTGNVRIEPTTDGGFTLSEPNDGFHIVIRDQLKTNAESMQNPRDSAEFMRAAKELIPRVKNELEQRCDAIVRYARLVRDAIAALREQERKCEHDASTTSDAEAMR